MDHTCAKSWSYMKIYTSDPRSEYLSLKNEINSSINKVLESGNYILGQEVENFEFEFSKYIGVKQSVGVGSGTDAIEIGLKSLGISTGDEIITVSHTAVATVSAIESSGATPVLIDIEEEYYTLNSSMLNEVYTSATKAVLIVHLYGQSCDMERIIQFCREKNIFLIEDASQAHGATYKERRIGSFGDISCFSFYPTKNLGAMGDGGMICTNSEDIAEKAKRIRTYGWDDNKLSIQKGRCSRLDEFQAAILRVKLQYLEESNNKRYEIALIYNNELKDTELLLPKVRLDTKHAYHLYVIKSSKREKIMNALISKDIFCKIHYPCPIHLQPAYIHRLRTSEKINITETVSNNILSLPIYPNLDSSIVSFITSEIKKVL